MAGFKKWALTPIQVLILFVLINILLLIDKGVLSAVIGQLEKKNSPGLGLSSFEAGLLGSARILGYVFTAPVYAYSTQFIHPQYLMGIGLTIWSFSSFIAAISSSFNMIISARVLCGIGTASFIGLAPPCILDVAPHKSKTKWISCFYSTFPIGFALGIVLGAQVSQLFGAWYYPFLIESVLMIPFILIVLCIYKNPDFYTKKQDGTTENFSSQILALGKNPLFLCIIIGDAAVEFTFVGLGFWVRTI